MVHKDSVKGNKGPDQTARMQSDLGLRCPHMPPKSRFRSARQYELCALLVPFLALNGALPFHIGKELTGRFLSIFTGLIPNPVNALTRLILQ